MAAVNETMAAVNETIAAANATIPEAVAVIVAPIIGNETAATGGEEMANATSSEQQGILFDKSLLLMQNQFNVFLN